MRGASVHFDFRGQIRLGERLFQNVLLIGRLLIVTGRNGDEELRLGLGGLQVRTVRSVGHQSAAMEGSAGAGRIAQVLLPLPLPERVADTVRGSTAAIPSLRTLTVAITLPLLLGAMGGPQATADSARAGGVGSDPRHAASRRADLR